jgi:hypothetical protein
LTLLALTVCACTLLCFALSRLPRAQPCTF